MSEATLKKFFGRHGIVASINYYTAGKKKIGYAVIGKDKLPALLFIHGTPASMTIYETYFSDKELLQHFQLYAVDRPGYGISGSTMPKSLEEEASLLAPLLEKIHRVHQPVIVLAGSYGASLACRIALDFPGTIQGLVLVAPSLGPGLENLGWLSKFLKFTGIKKLLPSAKQHAVDEKWHHKKDLEAMLPLWPKLDIPVYYAQSEHDPLISTKNAEFARQHMVNVPQLMVRFFPHQQHNIDVVEQPSITAMLLECLHQVVYV